MTYSDELAVVELHVAIENTEKNYIIDLLREVAKEKDLDVVRIFWRNFESGDWEDE